MYHQRFLLSNIISTVSAADTFLLRLRDGVAWRKKVKRKIFNLRKLVLLLEFILKSTLK